MIRHQQEPKGSLRKWGLRSSLAVVFFAALVACGGSGSSVDSSGPTITSQPTSLSVAEGSVASFTAVASGSDLQYQWYKDGAVLSGAASSAYTIASAASTDAGSYYLIVSNADGSVSTDVVTLTVTGSGGLDTTIK